MRSHWAQVALIGSVAVAVGCGSSPSGDGGVDAGGDAGTCSKNAMAVTGTFTGMASTGVTVSGSISGAMLSVSSDTSNSRTSFYVEAYSVDGGMVCTAPAGASCHVSVDLSLLTVTPAAGSYDGGNAYGDLNLGVSTSNLIEGFAATSPATGNPVGSWSLNFSSVTPVSNPASCTPYYAAHGTLNAQMTDGSSGSATLNLSF